MTSPEQQPAPAARPPRGPYRPVPRTAIVALAFLFGGVVGLGLFTTSYAEGTSYLSDDPASCRNCHVMNDVYDAWLKAPHHAVATCNDCHIPHDFPAKYVVKAMNGFNHSLAFTLQNFHEPIQITPPNKVVALNNCGYCHGTVMTLVEHGGQDEFLDCTRCHASIGHDEIGVGKP
jgi:cytochrome c nitrite reductase small subunit